MKNFSKLLQQQFSKMYQTSKLFRVDITGEVLWNTYLESFDKEDDPVFRDPNSSVHNCNFCKNFIRRYGNIVAVNSDNEIITIFDVTPSTEYLKVAQNLSQSIKNCIISEPFIETIEELQSLGYKNSLKDHFTLGVSSNVKKYTQEEVDAYDSNAVNATDVVEFNHMHLHIPKEMIQKGGKSAASIISQYVSSKEVFARAMSEISLDTLILVKDLIVQKSLLNGEAHLEKVRSFIELKKVYDKLPQNEAKRENWCWVNSYDLPIAKFKNELIGVLCSDLSEGVELNKACLLWNKRVDPVNYMKATAPITEKQINAAKKFITDNGYLESFNRRFATLDDINVSEILHSNVGDEDVKSVSIFDNVKSTTSRYKKSEFDKVEEVGIEKFMKEMLPSCSSIEVYLKNTHENNMVSLTIAKEKNAKNIFKWSNNYSWTFNGNLAGKSEIKSAVKSAGGDVSGVLRFSIMWSEGTSNDNSDLDAHCILPNKNSIYYSKKSDPQSMGKLDIDIQRPISYKSQHSSNEAVENITFPQLSKLPNGDYLFRVQQYAANNSEGFKAQVEFDGETYEYEYKQAIGAKKFINVATVSFKDGKFTINHHLPESSGSKTIYGLETNKFHKVNLLCLSPNHWGNNKVGNKHYIFGLKGCESPTPIRSFHNENLNADLLQHKKVLEVLGAKDSIKPMKGQVSGIGFNATVNDEVIVKLSGSFKRLIKIKF